MSSRAQPVFITQRTLPIGLYPSDWELARAAERVSGQSGEETIVGAQLIKVCGEFILQIMMHVANC